MLVYIILALVVMIPALNETGRRTQSEEKLLYFSLFVLLLVTGLRYKHGDYGGYELAYEEDFDIGQDWGYYQIQLLFHYFNLPFSVFVFAISLFGVIALNRAFQISLWPLFGMVFVLGKIFTFYAMSGIRQYIAMVICWWAAGELLRTNRKQVFVLMVVIAYLFHGSALVFLPMLLFVNREFKLNVILYMLLAAVFMGLFWESVFQYVIDLNDTVDQRFGNYLRDPDEEGMNMLNYVENLLFLLLAILVRKQAVKKIPYYDFFLYMFVIYCAIFLVGHNVRVVKRVRDYFAISYAFIVPAFIYLVEKKSQTLVKVVFILYFILLMFRSFAVYDSAFEPGAFNRMVPYHNVLFDK